ncbi:hypothetical protein LguiB_013111 [Lonicera macranthoides]
MIYQLTGDFITSYSEVHETFDLMGLMENLSRSIHAYGILNYTSIVSKSLRQFSKGE